ncbi:MAG: ABC transporter permease [Candidatus Dadabacteria bacterium]|nr:MAG: ABC transporter permease [Candidatus Dadabacteria bacterium]
MFKELWKSRAVFKELTLREIHLRYRGSFLGLLWSLFTPLVMLAVYTFVFGYVFSVRWDVTIENKAHFALVLFCGLTVFNIFAESVVNACSAIVANPNYVKKIIFPLEILPLVKVAAAVFQGLVAFIVLLLGALLVLHHLPLSVVLFPLILVPLILFSAGVSWIVASLVVYIRDVAQIVPLFTTILLFLSPIFYPVTAIPDRLRPLYMINPICYLVESSRALVIYGNWPDPLLYCFWLVVSLLVYYAGYRWFAGTRRGFADVI